MYLILILLYYIIKIGFLKLKLNNLNINNK